MANGIFEQIQALATDEGILGLLVVVEGYIVVRLYKDKERLEDEKNALQEKRLEDLLQIITNQTELRVKYSAAIENTQSLVEKMSVWVEKILHCLKLQK